MDTWRGYLGVGVRIRRKPWVKTQTMTTIKRLSGLLFVFALSFGAGHVAASAQQTAAPTREAPTVPEAVVAAALSDDKEAAAVVAAYLRADGAGIRRMTDRGVALIRALQRRGAGGDPVAVLGAADRVAALVTARLRGRPVMQLAIDSDFVPTGTGIALDFGPPDGEVRPGFERVLPGDPRLGGGATRALRRPDPDQLLSDGIAGVERVEIPVPDGTYRIILLTEPTAEPASLGSPFGSEVLIDGVAVEIAGAQPEGWVPQAYLTRRAADLARAEASGQPAPRLVARGGALLLEGTARGGKLVIEFRQRQSRTTYLSGLILEPIEEESSLWRSPEARDEAPTFDEQLNLEGELLSAVAQLFEEVAPAAGPEAGERLDLPEIIIEPEVTVSPS